MGFRKPRCSRCKSTNGFVRLRTKEFICRKCGAVTSPTGIPVRTRITQVLLLPLQFYSHFFNAGGEIETFVTLPNNSYNPNPFLLYGSLTIDQDLTSSRNIMAKSHFLGDVN